MCSLQIRQANEADVDILTEMDKICFDAPWSRESFSHELEKNDLAFYVIGEIDGKPAGYAGLWAIVDEGHITNVAVLPQWREQHVASAILQVMIEACQKSGLQHFTLEVRRGNEAAIKLYENFGFEVEGERPHYYEDNGEDALIMWLHLNK